MNSKNTAPMCPKRLDEACDGISGKLDLVAVSLNSIVVPMENAELYGFAHLLELLVDEINGLCSEIINIPDKAREV